MSDIDNLVDEVLTGDYKKVKIAEQAGDLVDVILDNCGKPHGKKKKVAEVVNDIDHVPDESAEGEHDKIKDQIAKPAPVEEVENAIDHEPSQDADELLHSVENEMSKEEDVRTETAEELVKKAFAKIREEKTTKTEDAAVSLVRKAFKAVKEEKAI